MARRILEDKKKRVNVFLNENERLLLKEKMEKYGFQNLSDYLRAVGIYENIYVEDLHGKVEVNECVKNVLDSLIENPGRLDYTIDAMTDVLEKMDKVGL